SLDPDWKCTLHPYAIGTAHARWVEFYLGMENRMKICGKIRGLEFRGAVEIPALTVPCGRKSPL
ncbi:MAG: hypothetical protein F7C35_00880, partial [Desulfurococcales archaeon]|nr:hypothetical protein [Desulfurococcales archaeon]